MAAFVYPQSSTLLENEKCWWYSLHLSPEYSDKKHQYSLFANDFPDLLQNL